MGQFFTNHHVRTEDSDAVADALDGVLLESAFVTEARGGWVSVFCEETESQDTARLAYLAAQVSERIPAAVFSFLVHDSDLFCYWLHEGGALTDAFNSQPDYFEPMPAPQRARFAGRAERLLPHCRPGTRLAELEAVLHPPLEEPPPPSIQVPPLALPEPNAQEMDALAEAILAGREALRRRVERAARQRYLFAGEQAGDLARLLGIDPWRACLGYRGVEPDDPPFRRLTPGRG